ncbi:MAG: hypothetical protein ACLRZ5_11710 [Ruminococcus sp.]
MQENKYAGRGSNSQPVAYAAPEKKILLGFLTFLSRREEEELCRIYIKGVGESHILWIHLRSYNSDQSVIPDTAEDG